MSNQTLFAWISDEKVKGKAQFAVEKLHLALKSIIFMSAGR